MSYSPVLTDPKWNINPVKEQQARSLPNVYTRKGTQLVDAAGKTVESWDSINTTTSSLNDKKSSVFINSSITEPEVIEYFRGCINGSGEAIKQCSAYLTNPNFHEASYQAVNNMSPDVALNLLKKYGFEVINGAYDPINNVDISVMEQWQHWNNRIQSNSGLDQGTRNAIQNNTNLKEFLTLLVNKVNRSPAIINSDYKGTPSSFPRVVGRIGQHIPAMPIPSSAVLSFSNLKDDPSSLEHVMNAFRVVAMNFGLRINTDGLASAFQKGGNGVNQTGGVLSFNSRDLITNSSVVFKHMYASLSNALERANKKISEPDRSKIFKLIHELEENEQKMNNSLTVIERFLDAANNGIGGDNEFNSLLEMQNIVNTRNKAMRSASKRQLGLVNIFGVMRNAIFGTRP